jgi:hypothetical protein
LGAAIRYSIFSGAIFPQASLNGGEYHTEMKLAAPVLHSTISDQRWLDGTEAMLDGSALICADIEKGHPLWRMTFGVKES